MVIPNRDLPESAFGQLFVNPAQLVTLLSDKALQFLNALHLDGFGCIIENCYKITFPPNMPSSDDGRRQ